MDLGLWNVIKTIGRGIADWLRKEEPIRPPPPPPPPPGIGIYREIIITFDTPAGTGVTPAGNYYQWDPTHVEVTAACSDLESRIPTSNQIIEKVLDSLQRNEFWSWILAMGMKIGTPEDEPSVEEWHEIHVGIRRLRDYEKVDEWTIPY